MKLRMNLNFYDKKGTFAIFLNKETNGCTREIRVFATLLVFGWISLIIFLINFSCFDILEFLFFYSVASLDLNKFQYFLKTIFFSFMIRKSFISCCQAVILIWKPYVPYVVL